MGARDVVGAGVGPAVLAAATGAAGLGAGAGAAAAERGAVAGEPAVVSAGMLDEATVGEFEAIADDDWIGVVAAVGTAAFDGA